MESMPVPDQKLIRMITVVGAFVVTITAGILMKQRIKGKEGAAGDTNKGSVSSSKKEREQSEGSDRDSHTSITSEYDVFLSFRGPDARLGIVDHLYESVTLAGLRVFKDDEEIRRGEVIGGELERAIRGSRVYVVVFSRNYASSAWCLRELKMMVDLCGGSNVGKKIILPIFYGADPSDVKLHTKLYREALDAHKGRHGQDVVKKWEDALKTVGGISGWDCKAIQGEGRFVGLIVQDIVVKLRIKDQSLPDHLTGIEDQVSNMLNLLDCDSSGVRLVVLHGMGGIGKTTLASVVFNKLLSSQFEGFSFISNVRESAKGPGGIAKLQNKLSRDILGGQYARSCNFDDGFREMIQRIRGKRTLLVLDDVDQFSQLEKLVGKDAKDIFGTGSRVIITTRDKSVCNRFVRPGSELLHFYEMEKMANNYALQLFSRHAFGTDEPPEDYLSLSKHVVKTTGNLPLALEVIGGHLCCQSKDSWKYELEKLKNVPREEVFEILKVSYDGLDWREKEIFLDIACFPEAMRLRYENYFRKDHDGQRYVDYLWEARGLYPKSGVKVLINKSLVKIDSKGEFWIHDQLRDMGREIILSEGDGRPERCTRLWDPEDALNIVLQKQVSKKIIAMTLETYPEVLKLSDENFSGLANLLFLDLKHTELTGEFENLWESLMWLSWRGYSGTLNSNFFKMRRLVVLKTDGIKGGWRSGEKLMMPNLKVLEFRNSDMTTSPDFSCCLNVEIMVFENCGKLKEIHHSVGKLESLAYLKIDTHHSLRSLPKELCFARALQELIVNDYNIEEVPESIGRLDSLRILVLHSNIRRLPTSICDLTNLLVLNLQRNPLDEGIPEEIGRLSALEELDLSWSSIRFLPATFSQLTSLKSLRLVGCEMLEELRGLPTSLTRLYASSCPLDKGIPDEIGSMLALERLHLSGSKIRFLPATISQLTSLKSLGLDGCRMLQEVRGLPTSLTMLKASNCPLDKGIPEEIGRLSALEELDLSGSKIRFLPAIISQLTSLKSLKLDGCNMLQEVRGLPTSLTVLKASNCPLDKGIPEEIGRLSALEELDLSGSKIRFLPATISQLTSLKSLKLDGCNMLREVRGLPTSLTYFEFSWKTVGLYEEIRCTEKDGTRIITFSGAFELAFLSRLKTLGRSFPNTAALLTYIMIRDFILTEMELGGLDSLPSLTRLSIWGSDSLLRVSNIGRLWRGLTLLMLRDCGVLVEIPGLEQLEMLEELRICLPSVNSLFRVSNIGRLRGLRSLKFIECGVLVEISGLEQLEMLEELEFRLCHSICRIQDLLGLKRLKIMDIQDCRKFLHVPRLIDKCRLRISCCVKLKEFEGRYSEYEEESSKIQLEDEFYLYELFLNPDRA